MFSIPRKNVIASDAGFSVEVHGPTRLRYVEGGKALLISSEFLNGPSGLAVYPSSIEHWDPPHDSELIDHETKSKIVENIRHAFRFRGFEIEIVS